MILTRLPSMSTSTVDFETADAGGLGKRRCTVVAESKLEEQRKQVRNLAFEIWMRRVKESGSYFGNASSDWFTARNQLGIPSELLL
jgi:hypothetical protein